VTRCSVHVASYAVLDDAVNDWEALRGSERDGRAHVIDAVLVESGNDTVVAFHRWSSRHEGGLGGTAATALIGLLRPVSIMLGAAAGGVGEQMLTVWSRTLSRAETKQLGDAFDVGMFHLVVVASQSPSSVRWRGADAVAIVQAECRNDDLEWAKLVD
jgi:hypothetical protein